MLLMHRALACIWQARGGTFLQLAVITSVLFGRYSTPRIRRTYRKRYEEKKVAITEGQAMQLWSAIIARPPSTRRMLMVSIIVVCFHSRRQLLLLAEGAHGHSFCHRESLCAPFLLEWPVCEGVLAGRRRSGECEGIGYESLT